MPDVDSCLETEMKFIMIFYTKHKKEMSFLLTLNSQPFGKEQIARF